MCRSNVSLSLASRLILTHFQITDWVTVKLGVARSLPDFTHLPANKFACVLDGSIIINDREEDRCRFEAVKMFAPQLDLSSLIISA